MKRSILRAETHKFEFCDADLGLDSKNFILKRYFYFARLENLISAVEQSLHNFGAAKTFAFVAHTGQLFEVALNNRKYMAASKFCELNSTAKVEFSNIAL
jgi:hypothetical protein